MMSVVFHTVTSVCTRFGRSLLNSVSGLSLGTFSVQHQMRAELFKAWRLIVLFLMISRFFEPPSSLNILVGEHIRFSFTSSNTGRDIRGRIYEYDSLFFRL